MSLTEMSFLILQVNFHTSNDFVIGVSLNIIYLTSVKGPPISKALTCMKTVRITFTNRKAIL